MHQYLTDEGIDDAAQLVNRWPWKPDPSAHPPKPPPRRAGYTHGGATLDVVAKELGVSRERVRQIETQALRKLRSWLRWYGLTLDDLLP